MRTRPESCLPPWWPGICPELLNFGGSCAATVSTAPAHFKGRLAALAPDCEYRSIAGIIPSFGQNCRMARHPKARGMLTHDHVWTALDRLAERAGMSASGLA